MRDTMGFIATTRRINVLISLSIFLAAFFYYLTYYNYSLNMIDEGQLADSAWRILNGQKMYRDFDHSYAPGQFYLFALLFKVFGEDILVSRLIWVVVISLNAVLIFLLSSRLMPISFAIIPTLVLLVVPAQWYKSFYIFLPLLNLLVLSKYLEKKDVVWLIAFGSTTYLSLMIRQDVGVFTLGTGFVVFLIKEIMGQRQGMVKRFAKTMGIYLLTILALSIPALIYFNDTLYYMFYRIFIHPISGAIQAIGIPFPAIVEDIKQYPLLSWRVYQTCLFYLPLITYLWLSIHIVNKAVRREFNNDNLLQLAVLLLAFMCYKKVFWEAQYDHLLQAIPLSYVIGAYLAYTVYCKIKLWKGEHSRTAGLMFLIALSIIPASFLYYNIFICTGNENGSIASRRTMHTLITSDKARVYYSDPNINKAIECIEDYTKPGDYIYVFPQSALFYFMTGRLNPTRLDMHILGFPDSVQELGIIKSIREKDVKLVIYDEVDTYLGVKRPERLYYKSYAKNAYKYVFDNYTIFDRAGRYRFMKKKVPGA